MLAGDHRGSLAPPQSLRERFSNCCAASMAVFWNCCPLPGAEAEAIAVLMKRYEDIRPQLADLPLVYLANREKIDTIFTLRPAAISRFTDLDGRSAFRIVPEME